MLFKEQSLFWKFDPGGSSIEEAQSPIPVKDRPNNDHNVGLLKVGLGCLAYRTVDSWLQPSILQLVDWNKDENIGWLNPT